jgi:hypothetical protein
MPAPHDLDPPSMTEEERLAKRRQEAAIAWELHVTKVYNELEAQRLAAIVEELAATGEPLDREMGDCVLCGAWETVYNGTLEERRAKHAPDCPWRMSSEYVDARTTHHTMP